MKYSLSTAKTALQADDFCDYLIMEISLLF